MPGLRQAIEDAFPDGKLDGGDEPASAAAPGEPEAPGAPEPVDTPAASAEGAESEATQESGGRARDEGGRFAKEPKAPAPKPKGVKPEADAPSTPASKGPKAAPPPAGLEATGAKAPVVSTAPAAGEAALKPPSSWKPLAREKWAALPPEVQQEVVRVDGEVRQVMQRAAGNQRIVESIQRTLQPFEQMIRAEGHQPLQAVESLLRQAHLMRFGAPAAKAQFVEGLIERNQIPVDAAWVAKLIQKHRVPVDALADMLEGKMPVPGQAQPAPALDPSAIVQQVMSAVDQREQAREQQRAQQEYQRMRADGDAFLAKQEFGEDVRGLVANLLELRAREGKALTLEEAYAEALEIHPDVRKTLKQRADAEAAKAKAASTQRARAAASSVRTQPSGGAPPSKPAGLRGAIEAAFEEAEQRVG